MLIKQISIFVENKFGRLSEILNVLGENDIDISALSIADTTEFGIMRIIVNKPEEAVSLLRDSGVTVKCTQVIALGVDDIPGGLAKAVSVLSDNNISIEYMYAFVGKNEKKAMVVVRVDDTQKAIDILTQNNITPVSCEEVYRF